jgi:hypothetical protein
LDRVFRDIHEPNGASGSDKTEGIVSRADMLSYFNSARRKINRRVKELKGETRIQGIINQIQYGYPFDFKSNMYRIEYDGKPLIKTNLATLDDYDKKWRNSGDRTPPDSIPKYFVLDEPDRTFIVYPPPPESGIKYDLITEDGIPEEIGDVDLTTEDGIPEEIVIEGETIDLTSEDGIPEKIIGQENNLKAFYYKHLIDVPEANNLEVEFEPHLESIKYFMKGLIFISPQKQDNELATFNFGLYENETDDIVDEKQHLRPPMAFSVRRKPGKQWGRWGRRTNAI